MRSLGVSRAGTASAGFASRPAVPVRTILLVGAGLAAAGATFAALPRPTFTASAVVGVVGGEPALRPAMVQAALDAALSRPVMNRAAAGLAAVDGSATPMPRFAAVLSDAVRAETGEVRGTLLVRARDAKAEQAAAMASAVATALIGALEDRQEAARRRDEATVARRISALEQAADAAHARLAALGADAAARDAGRAEAARIEALAARLDAVRAILASGTPPLGTGRDVPPGIEALQSNYLDLMRQLAKASETLGDRHATVIGLRDGIRRTSADLVTAWTRLAKATETELGAARRSAHAADGTDAGRAVAIEAARRAAQSADEALARERVQVDGAGDLHFRLIAPAPIPASAEGLPLPTRLAVAIATGLAAAFAAQRRRRSPEIFDAAPPAPLAARIEPSGEVPIVASMGDPRRDIEVSAETIFETDALVMSRTDEEAPPMDDTEPVAPSRAPNADLTLALAGTLPAIARIVPRAEVPVVMVATNEAGVATMEAALALAEAAADAGSRVLVVEGGKARPALAAAVDVEAVPAIIEVLGVSRVVLRAEAGRGLVYLAPSFRGGARLAADLVASGDVLVADALADEFDLVIIDGDRAPSARELTDHADAVLRVGRFAASRDDELFLSALGFPRAGFLGTLIAAAAVFVPRRVETSEPTAAPAPRLPSMPRPAAVHLGAMTTARRAIPGETRRRVGAR